jgi:hypothetical protein
VMQPICCSFGEFDRSVDRNLVVEMSDHEHLSKNSCGVARSVELKSGGRVVVGRFVMELSSIDEASAQRAGVCLMILVLGWVWLSVVGCLGSGESMGVKLRYEDD